MVGGAGNAEQRVQAIDDSCGGFRVGHDLLDVAADLVLGSLACYLTALFEDVFDHLAPVIALAKHHSRHR